MSGFLDKVSLGAALTSISSTVDGKFEFLGGMDASEDVNRSSRWCVLIQRPGEICCGIIGTAGKFCAVAQGSCSVASHTQKKAAGVEPGLFVRAGIPKEELFLYPQIALGDVTREMCVDILSKDFGSVPEVVQFFDEINNQEEVVRKQLTFEDANTAYAEKKVRVNTKTPAKWERENLLDRYDQLHDASTADSPLSDEVNSVLEKVKLFNQFLATQMNEGQTLSNITSEKLVTLKLEIGSWPSHAKASTPMSFKIKIHILSSSRFEDLDS